MDSSSIFFSISILFHSYSAIFWQWLIIDGRNILDNNPFFFCRNHVFFCKYRSMFIFSVCLNPFHKHWNIATLLSCKKKKIDVHSNQVLCFYSRIRIHSGNRYKNFKAPILYFFEFFLFCSFPYKYTFMNIFSFIFSLFTLHNFFFQGTVCVFIIQNLVFIKKKYIYWGKSILMNKIQQCVFLVNSAIQIEMAVFITLYDGLIL